jgi:hypothetical protein
VTCLRRFLLLCNRFGDLPPMRWSLWEGRRSELSTGRGGAVSASSFAM